MNYKILCSDLDGTLLTYKDHVSTYTINEIKRIRDRMRVILVSARMPKSMTYIQQALGIEDQPIICYNGALIMDGHKELSSTFISLDLIESIYQKAEKMDIRLGLYSRDEWYVEVDSERVQKEIKYTKAFPTFRNTPETLSDWQTRQLGAHKIMMMGEKEKMDTIFPLLFNSFSEHLNLYRSNDTLIEIAPKSVSKLTAINLLLQAGEDLKDVIAFGDNYNDIEMLQHAGHGVAVGNAREEVKEISNAIAPNNTEDGVARYINQHLFI
ncbi:MULTISPECIES: Cof-type HAD-IIB family hydrolase [Arenibacter]|uniref:Cof-type HAD-IIB family hydrolase n=1 Tax=Arenibacter TaxID=178469 RepID=UPI000A36AB03|nr:MULTISPECIES: Cof-type HAD-IIB family hydrolase [Arenibacter]